MIQEEYFGYNAIQNLEATLKKYSVKRIFLVTGKKSFAACGAEAIVQPVLSSYDTARFFDFEENPRIEDVKKGIDQFKKQAGDIVIAVGGGSVIDMAKLINIFSGQNGTIENYLSGENKILNNKKPLFAIPTTSGTGSESTHFAVIYKDKIKYSFADGSLMPDVAIVDPLFTLTLPPFITATTGMDALSQSIEAYWSTGSSEESKGYARDAIELGINSLKGAVVAPDRENRENMSKAAHLSGKAINISKTTAPHAISYAFTSYYGVKHGHAVGLTLGDILLYNSKVGENDVTDTRGISYVRQTMSQVNKFLGCEDAPASKNKLTKLMNDIGLQTDLREVGLKKETDIDIILDNVNLERVQNNPRALTREALKEILLNLMK